MKITDRLARALANRLKQFMPGPGGVGYTSGGWWSGESYDYETLELAYKANPWVHRSVGVIATTLSDVPLNVYREVGKGEDVEREQVFEHPLVDLLWRPSPRMSGSDMVRRIASYIALDGEAILFVENGSSGQNLGGQPQRLQILKPRFIDGVNVSRVGVIESYRYNQDGGTTNIAPEFIVHPMNYNPFDDTRGLPSVQVAQMPILLEYYMARYNQNFLKNDATPSGVLMAKGPLDEAARRANLDAWRKVYGASGKNARGVAHLDSETSFQQTGQSARDAEFINLDKLSREQILAIFGVPPFLVGVMEFANYANSSQQLKAFYNHTIMPMAKLIEDSFNNQLVEVWYGGESGLYVEFDFSGIDALREDLLKQAQVSSILVRDRIKTINEVRREMNLPDVPWGDDPPPDPFAITDLTLGHGRPTGTKGLSTRAINRESHWKAFSDTLASFEAGFAKAMRKYFRDQSQRIESKINQTFSLAMAGGHVPSGLADIIKAVGPEDLFAIYDLEAEDKLLQALTEPMYRRAVDKFGSAAARVAGQSSVWNVSDPRVANLIAEKVLLIKRINSTTKDMITAILVDAANDNATVSQVSRQLRTMFEDMAKTRSDTIARTEMIGASNGASMEGYRQAGADRKEWLSSRDADVRESHQDLDGEVVPLSSPFSNGLMFPGGSGPAEEVINCRCTLLPVVD